MSALLTADAVFVGAIDRYDNGNACFDIACPMQKWLEYMGKGYRNGLVVGVFTDESAALAAARQRHDEMERAWIDKCNAEYWARNERWQR